VTKAHHQEINGRDSEILAPNKLDLVVRVKVMCGEKSGGIANWLILFFKLHFLLQNLLVTLKAPQKDGNYTALQTVS
jgi:hypothetical protein